MQQHNISTNSSQGPPYDRSIADLEKRLFNESSDTTRRIHQYGYEDLMKLRNPSLYESKPGETNGLFKNLPPINENNTPMRDCEFQENICRYFKGPYCGNEFYAQFENGNIEQNANGPYPNSAPNSQEPLFRNYNYEQNQGGFSYAANKPNSPPKPLKSILRNTVCRADIENNQDFSTIRQVSFEPQCQICASNSIIFKRISSSRIPGQMEWAPQYCCNDLNSNQNYCCNDLNSNKNCCQSAHPMNTNPQYSTQNVPGPHISENDAFKCHYLHVKSNFIPEEKTQSTYVNDPSHNLNYYNYNARPNRNDMNESSTSPKYEGIAPVFAPRYTSRVNLHEIFSRPNPDPSPQIPPNNNLYYQNLNQPEMHNNFIKAPFTPAPNNFNQSDKYATTPQGMYTSPQEVPQFFKPDENATSFLQPRTQQRETVYLGEKEPAATHPLAQTVHSSQPCYAIPADMAYFHSDRFELFVDAKLLMPDKIRVNILPEKVELYGCTEYYSVGSKSLLEIKRIYDLPTRITPEKTNCLLNTEGILFITAYWEKPL